MTNLALETLDTRAYLTELVNIVRAERDRVQHKAPDGAQISCIIEHSVTFTSEGSVEKAQLKYGMSNFNKGKMSPPNYEVKELVDGEDYNYDVITDLIKAAADDCNMAIDMFVMNADVMYTDDITARIENFIATALLSFNIEEGYSVSTIVVSGGISQITITVS